MKPKYRSQTPQGALIAQTTEQRRLFQLQAEWRISDTLAQEAIAKDIKEHPQWGIACTEDGPQFATATQKPANMAFQKRLGGRE